MFCPTDPFTILELLNPSYGLLEQNKICRSPERKALKLWKGRSGEFNVRRRFLSKSFIFRQIVMIKQHLNLSVPTLKNSCRRLFLR